MMVDEQLTTDSARAVLYERIENAAKDGSPPRGQDRGSRAGRFREGRLRRLRTHGVADTGIPDPARAKGEPQGA